MRIFVAGASGAIGKRLVPLLVEAGHSVVGTTRTPEKADLLRGLGAEPVVLDALDAPAVGAAIARAEPDVIVHELTALAGFDDLRKFDEQFAETNRLRTEGTDNLLAAAHATGVSRFVAQSYAGWPLKRVGPAVKPEDAPLDDDPPAAMRNTLDAIRHLERRVRESGGVVLRYGAFYGPGTSLDRGGAHLEAVRRRKFPIVGDGGGVWSFVHVDDAAEATVAAIEHGRPGIYNVVDDEPAPVAVWLPALADALGAPRPRHVPTWLARLLIGDHGVTMMTEARGASNEKAKDELRWRPAHASWREGFAGLAHDVGEVAA